MVRLVFRPYTRVWRAICTSASLRASTRVSSGFALPRHSSPSFGSQHYCSRSDLQSTIVCRLNLRNLDCFHCALRFENPLTRSNARLLGPCFKTGRIASLSWTILTVREPSAPFRSKSAKKSPRQANTTECTEIGWTAIPFTPTQSASSVTVSGSFHPLFRVLVNFPSRYLFAIGLQQVFSLRWDLPPIRAAFSSYPTRLKRSWTKRPVQDGRGSNPPRRAFSCTLSWTDASRTLYYNAKKAFHIGLFPLRSPLLRESLLVSFPPLNYMLKFSG